MTGIHSDLGFLNSRLHVDFYSSAEFVDLAGQADFRANHDLDREWGGAGSATAREHR